MLFVAVPWAMSFRTLCLPCGTCRPRYVLRIFRPTMPSTYASPRAVSLVVFTDMAIVRREISSSISYTASFLGTICLEVLSPIPTVFFLHLTVALQRRTVYDFLISGHLLPDRELREREPSRVVAVIPSRWATAISFFMASVILCPQTTST